MSERPTIKFSGAEDPNDPIALQRSIQGLNLDRPPNPKGFGGVFSDPANKGSEYASFNTHTPPDITGNTRVIAVLGITTSDASPGETFSGWMLSDFFAFWHLFNGTTTAQTWYHCLDLDSLIGSHTRYLHGNPYKTRKVVLDADILKKVRSSKFPLTYNPENTLCSIVKQKIKQECQAAHTSNENVLVLMFGHGDAENKGIQLGKSYRCTLKVKDLAVKNVKARITVLTTHCYGGGWTCNPHVNMSTLTAAGSDVGSLSWRKSGSSGRHAGSMYATAIIRKMMEVGEARRPLGPKLDDDGEEEEATEEQAKEQAESFAEFSRSVYRILLQDVDRRGYEHEITFGAQDDAWAMCWRERTGFPLADYSERWNGLSDWEADRTLHPGDPLNRDPSVTEQQREEYLKLEAEAKGKKVWRTTPSGRLELVGSVLGKRQRQTSGLYGGTHEGLRSVVVRQAQEYLESYKGSEDSGPDAAVHGLLGMILEGRANSEEDLERALRMIQYRMNSMSTADDYLEFMDIPAPSGLPCHDYDTGRAADEVPRAKAEGIFQLIYERKVLFPKPIIEEQGRGFQKPVHYLAVAFHQAKTSREDVVKKLDELAAILDQSIEATTDNLTRDPEIKPKRQRLFQAFGERLGSLSPKKRRTRGHSLSESVPGPS